MVLLVAGLGFEPRIAKAYETLPVTGPFPRNYLSIVKHTTELCWTATSSKTCAMCFIIVEH